MFKNWNNNYKCQLCANKSGLKMTKVSDLSAKSFSFLILWMKVLNGLKIVLFLPGTYDHFLNQQRCLLKSNLLLYSWSLYTTIQSEYLHTSIKLLRRVWFVFSLSFFSFFLLTNDNDHCTKEQFWWATLISGSRII